MRYRREPLLRVDRSTPPFAQAEAAGRALPWRLPLHQGAVVWLGLRVCVSVWRA